MSPFPLFPPFALDRPELWTVTKRLRKTIIGALGTDEGFEVGEVTRSLYDRIT